MNKNIMIGCLLTVFMLVTISYATAINSEDNIIKVSPLYKVRANRAIKEKIVTLFENIKSNFLGEKIFWIPSKIIRFELNPSEPGSIYTGMKCTNWCYPTECNPTECGRVTSCCYTKNDNC